MRGRGIDILFSRNRKTLYMILGIMLVSIFSLTIVYAALSVTLKITGNTEVVASSWDIHLDNVRVTSGSVSGIEPSITSPTTATFSTRLEKPGDFFEFSIDVVNDGSIDAMIDGVTKTPTLTETQAKYLNYIIEYQSGESINKNQLVSAGSFVRLKVRLEFRKDLTSIDLPTSNETLNLTFTVNYVQADETEATIVPDNGIKNVVKVVKGNGTNTSDEICIGEECFYVISSTEDEIIMLAKYNLHVGNKVDEGFVVTPLSNPTGIQAQDAKGYVDAIFPAIGTTSFSNTGIDYSGSIVQGYINSYNSYLIAQGLIPNETRLITKTELINLGCDDATNSCFDAPRWVCDRSYWTWSTDDKLGYVDTVGDFGSYNFYKYGYYFGVRPVIVIDRNLIGTVDDMLIEFSIDPYAYEAEEGMTWGEWVDSEYNFSDEFSIDEGNVVSEWDESDEMWLYRVYDETVGSYVDENDVIIPDHSYVK